MEDVKTSRTNMPGFLRDHGLKIVAGVFWLIIIVAIVVYQRSTGLPPGELAAQLAVQLEELIAGTWYGPLIYTFIYFLRPVILFPATILALLAGNLYGLWAGLFWGLLAGTVSSIIPFFVGRWFAGSALEQEEETDELGRIARFTKLLQDNPFEAIITMRLLFLPYDLVSIFAGSLRVPFWKFFAATFLGNIVGSFSYVAVGASVQGNPFTEEVTFNPWILVAAGVMLVLSLGISRLLKRRGAVPASETAS